MAYGEGGQLARAELVQGIRNAREMLRERLASREAEVGAGAPPRLPQLRIVVSYLVDQPPLPRAAVGLGQALVHTQFEPKLIRDDRGRLARAGEVAGPHDPQALAVRGSCELARLRASTVVQRRIPPALHPRGRHVVIGLAVAGEQDQPRPWKSWSVSARSPSRRVSRDMTSPGRMFPRFA